MERDPLTYIPIQSNEVYLNIGIKCTCQSPPKIAVHHSWCKIVIVSNVKSQAKAWRQSTETGSWYLHEKQWTNCIFHKCQKCCGLGQTPQCNHKIWNNMKTTLLLCDGMLCVHRLPNDHAMAAATIQTCAKVKTYMAEVLPLQGACQEMWWGIQQFCLL